MQAESCLSVEDDSLNLLALFASFGWCSRMVQANLVPAH